MNYFAHGRHFVDDPYLLAGTAVPDWLSVVDRRVRVRAASAQEHVDDDDPRIAAVARGVAQHHYDDGWFHQTRAFSELTWQTTVDVRDVLPADGGMRPSFLGHILVELLLDAILIDQQPELLEAYYDAVDHLDPVFVQVAVNRMSTRTTDRLAPLVPRFSAERFLCDYADDEKLLFRLNQVMQRVRLPELPPEFCQVMPPARRAVERRVDELLPVADAACK